MVNYLHFRFFDETEKISNQGGATIAYTELEGMFCLNVAWCSHSDNFCRKLGRTIARNRLKVDGPLDVIEAVHPRTRTLADWATLNLFDVPVRIDKHGKHWIIQA